MRTATFLNLRARILVPIALALVLAACNPLENETKSMSMLLVESLSSYDSEGKQADYCQSDILYEDPDTGAQSIFADIASAVLSARMLDPAPLTGVSPYADIQLTRYTVTYFRADGRNMPGTDVPYPFEGQISTLVKPGQMYNVNFILVRETAKEEPPLLNIIQPASRAEALIVDARIDFYGHDLTGNAVKATGYLPITFANYANGSGSGSSAAGSPSVPMDTSGIVVRIRGGRS